MVKVGKNQDESVMRLWLEMEWATPSGPLQLPAGHLFETATTSLRDPEGKLRSIRASPVASDAAGGAGKGDVGERVAAGERGQGLG
jgi:hypothetical protein